MRQEMTVSGKLAVAFSAAAMLLAAAAVAVTLWVAAHPVVGPAGPQGQAGNPGRDGDAGPQGPQGPMGLAGSGLPSDTICYTNGATDRNGNPICVYGRPLR